VILVAWHRPAGRRERRLDSRHRPAHEALGERSLTPPGKDWRERDRPVAGFQSATEARPSNCFRPLQAPPASERRRRPRQTMNHRAPLSRVNQDNEPKVKELIRDAKNLIDANRRRRLPSVCARLAGRRQQANAKAATCCPRPLLTFRQQQQQQQQPSRSLSTSLAAAAAPHSRASLSFVSLSGATHPGPSSLGRPLAPRYRLTRARRTGPAWHHLNGRYRFR
jgi:hypothetical protein